MRVLLIHGCGYLVKFRIERMLLSAMRDRTVVGGYDHRLRADYAAALKGEVVATLRAGGEPEEIGGFGEWREYSLYDYKTNRDMIFREPDADAMKRDFIRQAIEIYDQENPGANNYNEFRSHFEW